MINKGINKSIEFKGLKAQYIWYVGGGMMALMVLFAILYIIGISQYVCLAIILPLGGFMVHKIYGMSNRYGEHGMMKMLAKRSVPKVLKINNRRIFFDLKTEGINKL